MTLLGRSTSVGQVSSIHEVKSQKGELTMRRVTDQVILIIYGLILGCTIKIDASLVIALLLAISYLAMMTLADAKSLWRPILLTGLFFTFSIIYPLCLLFSPLIAWTVFEKVCMIYMMMLLTSRRRLKKLSPILVFVPLTFLITYQKPLRVRSNITLSPLSKKR